MMARTLQEMKAVEALRRTLRDLKTGGRSEPQ
jgi:hypothetical protein